MFDLATLALAWVLFLLGSGVLLAIAKATETVNVEINLLKFE